MKFKYLLVLSGLFISACDDESAIVEPELVEVYISKGDTQCNNDGLSLSEVTSYLSDAEIEITESMCGHILGISHDAVCGGGTNNVYSFIISTESLLLAENLGFQSLSSLDSELSIETVDCP
jgi:hypothetical protein